MSESNCEVTPTDFLHSPLTPALSRKGRGSKDPHPNPLPEYRERGTNGRRAWLVLALVLLASPGCGLNRESPLSPDPAMQQRQVHARPSVQPVDAPGPVVHDDAPPAQTLERAPVDATSPEGFSPTVDRAIEQPGVQPQPATAPARDVPAANANAAPAAPNTTGGYQLVGTVLAEVNGEPIFADKVLATLEKVLAAAARQLDERQFRMAAAQEIDRQIAQFVNDELEYAMAKNRLDPRDIGLAKLATIRWRDEQISQAGGSVELARQRVEAAGLNFEELERDREKWFMRKIYYEKKEYPKLQVSATDLRRYYHEHLASEFTTPDRARFRVIKVDQRKAGGRDAALAEINRLLELVRGGKDFAELAAEDNDEESFKRPVEWFQRGAFAVKAVEDAVWQIQPGTVTDPIETPDAFYIARLEIKEPGQVRAFDGDIQEKISTILKERQFATLRQKVRQALKDDAIIRYHPRMIELAVEMAMQKYRYWREGRG